MDYLLLGLFLGSSESLVSSLFRGALRWSGHQALAGSGTTPQDNDLGFNYMFMRHVITMTVSSSAKDEGPPSTPETEDGLL